MNVTPGPFVVQKVFRPSGAFHYCRLTTENDPDLKSYEVATLIHNEADANLFAAAPNLLLAARLYLEKMNFDPHHYLKCQDTDCFIDKVQRAVLIAEGVKL